MCWAMSAEAPQTEHLKLSEQDVAYLVGRGGHTRMRLERFSYTRLEISRGVGWGTQSPLRLDVSFNCRTWA